MHSQDPGKEGAASLFGEILCTSLAISLPPWDQRAMEPNFKVWEVAELLQGKSRGCNELVHQINSNEVTLVPVAPPAGRSPAHTRTAHWVNRKIRVNMTVAYCYGHAKIEASLFS